MEFCSIGSSLGVLSPQAERVQDAAERLACLLSGTEAFQDYVRLSRSVRQDEEVSEILAEINAQVYSYDPSADAVDNGTLEQRLESLPVVRQFRRAEGVVRALFRAVDDAISAEVGLCFAENAKSSACG